MARTLAIGDIHGGLRALQQVLDRAEVTAKDSLIFLGDYVDGWSDSAQLIDFLIDLAAKQSCIFIKGNHDIWCEGWLEYGQASNVWLEHGGSSTAKSYRNYDWDIKSAHISFFKKMKYFFVDIQNRLFIHAGFTSLFGPEQEYDLSNCAWDRTLWETAMHLNKSIEPHSSLFPKRLKLFGEIFIGHTPTLNYNTDAPMNKHNVWNIDTGAAFHGRLSIMDVQTKAFWQSDIVQTLYPDERGRN
ncbi:MAG: metallophosphoesterase [Spirosomataceae bacterium]